MGKNEYAKRIRQRKMLESEITQMWTAQLCLDCMTIALNETFGIGAERLTKMGKAFNDIYGEAIVGLSPDVSASHVRRLVDERLKTIMGGEFEPWPERYYLWNDHEI